MNLQAAAFTVLLAVTASAQARSPTPTQAQSPAGAMAARHAGMPFVAAQALPFPAKAFPLPAKTAIALPPGFEMSVPDPLPSPPAPKWSGPGWNGPIVGTMPGTRQPPVVPEAPPTNVPPPHCGARPC